MKISVSQPYVGENEIAYLNEALQSGAISGVFGKYIGQFKEEFAEFCGVDYAISCSSGTAALHLGVMALSLPKNSKIITTPLTFVATANSIILNNLK